jgi:hypothetical protein
MPGGRGGFVGAPGAWRWVLESTPCLAGPVCPVADADGAYTITVELVFDVPPSAAGTGWGGVYFGVTTDDCPDDVDPSTGYLVALGWDGTLEVRGQPADGTGMVGLGATTTSPIRSPVLADVLPAGLAVTEIPVTALPGPVAAGHRFTVPTGQVATVTAPAAQGGTSLAVGSVTPSADVPAGTALAQQVTLTIEKTPAGFTAGRTDDGASATYEDATWSGGYLFLRKGGDPAAAVSCSSLTISEQGRPAWGRTS